MKPLILFVDDELNLLSGLRRLARNFEDRWDMEFVSSGEAALAVIESRPVNLVITDMRMPGMDGARLLELIEQEVPGLFAFALSGETNVEQAIRVSGRSHRFLAKPIDPAALFGAIGSLFDPDSTFLTRDCCRALSVFDRLKTTQGHLSALRILLEAPERNGARIVAQIMSDPSLAIRVLQLANSAYFGKALHTSSIPKAVGYIGTARLAQLIAADRLGTEYPSQSAWNHDNAARAAAAMAARDRAIAGDLDENVQTLAYATALISGIGADIESDPVACATRSSCIAALFGLPPPLVASLAEFGESHGHEHTAEGIAEGALAVARNAIAQIEVAA